jgi:Skp family chaperone for outer membrane proteins
MGTTRTRVTVGIAVVCAGLAGLGLYQTASKAPPTSVALVDMEKLMGASDEVKARNDQMNKTVEPLQKELNDLGERYKKMKADLDLAKDSKDKRQRIASMKESEYQYKLKGEMYQGLIDYDRGDLMREAYQSALDAIKRVAQRDGFQVVMLDDRGAKVRTDVSFREVNGDIFNKRVLFAEESVDITERVITEMNAAFNTPTAPTTGTKGK